MENIGAYVSTACLALAIGTVAIRGFYREAKNIKKGACGCSSGGGCGGQCGCGSGSGKSSSNGCGCSENSKSRKIE